METISPDTGTVMYVYDESGNLVWKKDAKNIEVEYGYDDLNRLTDVIFPDPSENITYSYDQGTNGIGKRTGMVDPSGNMAFGYNDRGRLINKTMTVNGIDYPVSRQYTPRWGQVSG